MGSLNTEVVYYRSRQELRMLNILLYAILITCVSCVPAGDEGGSCGSDERGLERQPGDSWQEDCNRCRCLSTGVKGCTRKFCGGEVSRKCVDSQGQERQDGERWEETPDICSCTEGLVVCTSLAVIPGTKKDKNSGVRFPGANNQDTAGQDSQDRAEEDGQDRSLFTRVPGKDVSQTAQCRQAGVSNCVAVNMNYQYLDTVGQSLSLIQGSGVTMNLRHPPTGSTSLSYNFSLGDGGEGTVTVRHNTGSVFASIRPSTGPVLFYIEACGQGCTVMYQRQKSYFNQFTD